MQTNIAYDWIQKYSNYFIALAALAALGAGGWFGYRLYVDKYEQSAYKDLAENIEGFQKAVSSGNSARYLDVERAFAIAGDRHKKSKLYPYFLAYKADILGIEGKQKEAIETMNALLSSIDKKQPLYYLYAIKSALMKLDSSDEAVKNEGRTTLMQLAEDNQNPVRDMALYYRGLEAWQKGDVAEGKKFWNQIVMQGKKDSPWYRLAAEKMGSA